MTEHDFLHLRSLHAVLLPHLFGREGLYGRKPLALGGVADAEQDYESPGHSSHSGKDEAGLPPEGPDNGTYHYEGKELADIGTRTENPVVGPPLVHREPPGKIDYPGRGPHGLHPPVDSPEHREGKEEGHRSEGGVTVQETEHSHYQVYQGRDCKARGHEAPYVAVVGYEAVHELADGVDEQQGRPYDSQLTCRKELRVNDRLLHHAQAEPAHIIKAVMTSNAECCFKNMVDKTMSKDKTPVVI